VSSSNGTVTVSWPAGTGGTFFLGIKYDTTSLKGATKPGPGNLTYVDYQFVTSGVPGSTQGLRLSKKI
jgi:hypothetical protein